MVCSPQLRCGGLLPRLVFSVAVIVVFILTMIPLSDVPTIVSYQDKVEHAVAFFGLMLLGWAGWPNRTLRLALGLVAYGLLIELCQHFFTVNRFGEALDWLADSVGVALAWWLVSRQRVLAAI